MIFSENIQVIYKEMQGLIDFVCDKYVVIKLNTDAQYTSPRVLVYRDNYQQIEILKASTK
jgi:hypothetical protein